MFQPGESTNVSPSTAPGALEYDSTTISRFIMPTHTAGEICLMHVVALDSDELTD